VERSGGDTITNACSAVRQRGGGERAFHVSSSCHLPSAQSNPYAKMAYFGVRYSAMLSTILQVSMHCLYICNPGEK